jgi:hypothetical protein
MKNKAKVGLITKVTAVVKDEHGKITHVQEGKNVITEEDPVSAPSSENNGLIWLLERAFAAGSYYDDDDYIKYMQLGKGTPTAAGLGSPYATEKTIQSGDIAFDEVATSWYNDPTIEASVTWDSGDGAFSGITEVGLFTGDTSDILFAYKEFTPALAKTAPGELTITWEIKAAY